MRLSTRRGEGGQAMVELALALPIVLLLLFGIAEFGRIYSVQLALEHAVREGARAGAIGMSDEEITAAVRGSLSWLDPLRLTIRVSPDPGERYRGQSLEVRAEYPLDVNIPLIGDLVGRTLPLTAGLRMMIE